MLVTGFFPQEKLHSCFGLKVWQDEGGRTSRGALTDVNRCMMQRLQLAEVLILVDTKRLPSFAILLLHSKTSSSSAALSSSEVKSQHSLNMTQGPIAQRQTAPALHIPH